VIVTGEFAEVVKEAAVAAGMPPERVTVISDPSEIAPLLAGEAEAGDLILFKASRALQLEKAAAALAVLIGRRN
jgi:UDP-N-acetylmuramyl pentapeptide synthase